MYARRGTEEIWVHTEGNGGHLSIQSGEWRGSVCAKDNRGVPRKHNKGNRENVKVAG